MSRLPSAPRGRILETEEVVGKAQSLGCTSAQRKSVLLSSLVRVAAHLNGLELQVDPAQRDWRA